VSEKIIVTCCSDLHYGPPDNPATDATPGWEKAWNRVPTPKLMLGDMTELLQFRIEELDRCIGTSVEGNHDRGRGPKALWLGDTLFTHGHIFDPWYFKFVEPLLAWIGRFLESIWPNIDIWFNEWLSKRFKTGKYGEAYRYAVKAAAYAKMHGAKQIVFGHLHQRFDDYIDGVHVVCVGCCVNGHMDFVEVEVDLQDYSSLESVRQLLDE